MDHPMVLPHDVLTAVLQRLAPRSLAVSRCMCREWRAIIDARCTLRTDLLPVSVGGIFVSVAREPAPPEFFARPSTGPRIAARLQDYVEMDDWFDIPLIRNCCNGLLLLDGRVVNPATRQWVRLPSCGALPHGYGCHDAYLAFDPTESPHYHVLLIDTYFFSFHTTDDRISEGSAEWPPSPYTMHVYSSRAGTWEARPFAREGGAAGTIADVRSADEPEYRHAVYWHETLYVHCRSDYIMRISLSDNKYRVIKLPAGINASVYHEIYLGKSKKGVYCAVADNGAYRLRVLFLSEIGDRIEWIFKYDIDLGALVAYHLRNPSRGIDRPWTLQQDGNQHEDSSNGVTGEENLQWDSDTENLLDIEDRGEKRGCECISIFGFHPFKEVVFLFLSYQSVMACHLESSKIQDLGQLTVGYHGDVIDTAFVYTPCMAELC